ncbi:MAG: hypothetical protein GY924_24275 [Planctomycetaceae bacterium]|nr:hypothetical protein [Planctomycetaceae bacterium]
MFRTWSARVITYDGLLPLAVWLTPWFVALVVPGRRGVIEILAILLPVVGCLIRFSLGRRLITGNLCSAQVRRCQFAALSLGLVLLALIDCVIVLLYVMPRGAFGQPADWGILVGLWIVYFSLMAGAMYPGRHH